MVDDAALEAQDAVELNEIEARIKRGKRAQSEERAKHKHKPSQATKDLLIGEMAVAPNLREGGTRPKDPRRSPVTMEQFFNPSPAKATEKASPLSPHA